MQNARSRDSERAFSACEGFCERPAFRARDKVVDDVGGGFIERENEVVGGGKIDDAREVGGEAEKGGVAHELVKFKFISLYEET